MVEKCLLDEIYQPFINQDMPAIGSTLPKPNYANYSQFISHFTQLQGSSGFSLNVHRLCSLIAPEISLPCTAMAASNELFRGILFTELITRYLVCVCFWFTESIFVLVCACFWLFIFMLVSNFSSFVIDPKLVSIYQIDIKILKSLDL